MAANLSCVVDSPKTAKCTNVDDNSTIMLDYHHSWSSDQPEFWLFLSFYIFLVMFAGFMSGLTLAILSLDVTSLQVMVAAGSERKKKYARRILPLSRRHHWVLVALVVANSIAVEAMPLVLDQIADTVVSLAVSVTAVLFIGEVLPQAVCSRYGLAIGYYCAWMVWGLIGVFFVIAYPVSCLLDRILGEEHATFYRRAELRALVDMHGPSLKSKAGRNPLLTDDEVKIITSALEMTSKKAHMLVTPMNKVYMLSADGVFDYKTLREILDAGHSRIPIFDGDRSNIVGIVLAKKLILMNPKAKISIREAMDANMDDAFLKPYIVEENESMQKMLDMFQTGITHMAFVQGKNAETGQAEIRGIVTLEHIVEALLQEDVWDETDKLRRRAAAGELPGATKLGIDSVQQSIQPEVKIKKSKSRSISLSLSLKRGPTSKQMPPPKKAPAKEAAATKQISIPKQVSKQLPLSKAASSKAASSSTAVSASLKSAELKN